MQLDGLHAMRTDSLDIQQVGHLPKRPCTGNALREHISNARDGFQVLKRHLIDVTDPFVNLSGRICWRRGRSWFFCSEIVGGCFGAGIVVGDDQIRIHRRATVFMHQRSRDNGYDD